MRKPGAPRATYLPDAVDEAFGGAQVHGTGHGTTLPSDDSGRPAGTLWVPDPETRHGWREYYIYPPASESRPRGVGFARHR